MVSTKTFLYCDKCGKPLENYINPEDPAYSFCPDCALALFQKIFGNAEDDGQ